MDSIWPEASALFTERLNVKVRPEMRRDLDRIAAATGLTTSDVSRYLLQVGIDTLVGHEEGTVHVQV